MERRRWLVLIGVVKLLKGVFFVILGFGLLRMLHRDIYMMALQVVTALHLDPDRALIAKLLETTAHVTDRHLRLLIILVFVYSGVDFLEGIGLMLKKRWAEYLTLIVTVALLPLEIFKLIQHPNHWTVIVLAVNIAIAVYLAWIVKTSSPLYEP